MYSDASQKLQNEMEKTIIQIETAYLRKIEGDMHRCSAKCCDDETLPREKFRHCVENCGIKLQETQTFLTGELDNFRQRLDRCHMACSDEIRDKMSATPSRSEIEQYRGQLDSCANKCAETHLELISQIFRRTKEFMSKNNL